MKFMFDECFTPGGAAVIGEFLSLYDPPIESWFLNDFLEKEGVRDETWGPILTGQDWIVISRDRGQLRRIKSKGAPLPIVLPRSKVTGVFLSGNLGNASRFEMVQAVVAKMPDILAACPAQRAEPGTRFRLSRDGGGFSLSEWPIKKQERKYFS